MKVRIAAKESLCNERAHTMTNNNSNNAVVAIYKSHTEVEAFWWRFALTTIFMNRLLHTVELVVNNTTSTRP
jgi:hypothetical protein